MQVLISVMYEDGHNMMTVAYCRAQSIYEYQMSHLVYPPDKHPSMPTIHMRCEKDTMLLYVVRSLCNLSLA